MRIFDGVAKQKDLRAGDVVVALDPQERLGRSTWTVFVQGDGTLEGDTVQRGLFWNKEDAMMFAAAIEAEGAKKEGG